MKQTPTSAAPATSQVAPSPLVLGTTRTKRPRIAPGSFVRCASTSPHAEDMLRRVAVALKDQVVKYKENPVMYAAPVSAPFTNSEILPEIFPETVSDAFFIPRGRPSRIAVANRARLFGPEDDVLAVSLVETTNYDQFIIPAGVEFPTESRIQSLAELITHRNELRWNPIRVTPYLEVFDGKRRLEAARLLQVPLTYLVDETLSVGDIVMERGEARGWEFDQYCLYYAEQGRSDYRRLLAFSDQHGLPKGAAASLLTGGKAEASNTQDVLLAFKRGQFRVTDEAHAKQVVAIRDEYRLKFGVSTTVNTPGKRDITKQRVFLNALSRQLARPDVSEDQMSNILVDIRWQPTEGDYERHVRRLLREANLVAA